MERLTGKKVLKFLEDNKQKTAKQLAIEAGYFTDVGEGKIRANVNAFYRAVLDAQGISVGEDNDEQERKRGRDLSYIITVQQSGTLVIGAGYTKKMGLNPGDEFEIRLGRKRIYLNPLNEFRLKEEAAGSEESEEEDLVAA